MRKHEWMERLLHYNERDMSQALNYSLMLSTCMGELFHFFSSLIADQALCHVNRWKIQA